MKALVIHGAKDLRLETRDAEAPGPGQVAVALKAGGICGSDLHYYNHGGLGPIKLREPMVLGHEVAGEIVELGPDVEGLRVGQLVAISPSRPCYNCLYCRGGQLNHCLNMRFYGSAMPFPHIQGAFQEYLVAEAEQCVVADGLTAGEAAMAEPLAVALHAVKQAGNLLGARVLVTGSGPIGALTILVARRAGAAEIIATDLSDYTLAKAKAVGADQTYNILKQPQALAPYSVDKGQVDVHFECSGAAAALASGIPVLRPAGQLIQLGLGGDINVPMQALTAKEISLKGSFRFHFEFKAAVSLMQKGLINVSDLITQNVPLHEAIAGFEMASDRGSALKVQIAF